MGRTVVDWPNGMKFVQQDGQFKLTTDSVLLAAFASVSRCKKGCELGCGIAGIALQLACRGKELQLDCVELQAEAAELARENVQLNALQDRVRIIQGDLRDASLLQCDSYDLVVCNPPYFVKGTGKPAKSDTIEIARAEENCTIEDVCAAAGRLLKTGGRFAVVFRAERMVDLFCAMRANRLEPKRLRRIVDKQGQTPTLILVEARKDAGVSLVHEPDLVMRQANGEYTQEVLQIYSRA